jgi:hypothetical protein
VQQPGRERLLGVGPVAADGPRQPRHPAAVHVQLVEVEAFDRRLDGELPECLGREHERAEGLETEVCDGIPQMRDRTAAPEIRRVRQLQNLGGHRDVTLDDPCRVLSARLARAQQLAQLQVEPRHRRQRRRAGQPAAQLDPAGYLVQRARALEHARQLFDLARLGQQSVCDAGCARDHPELGLAGEDDSDRRWVKLADPSQQRRAVHARHPQVGDDDVVRMRLEHGQRVLAAGHEPHGPSSAMRPQRVAQAVQHVALVVDEEDSRRVLKLSSR